MPSQSCRDMILIDTTCMFSADPQVCLRRQGLLAARAHHPVPRVVARRRQHLPHQPRLPCAGQTHPSCRLALHIQITEVNAGHDVYPERLIICARSKKLTRVLPHLRCFQYSSALGPFEGGLHFHKDFNTSILKSMACARSVTFIWFTEHFRLRLVVLIV